MTTQAVNAEQASQPMLAAAYRFAAKCVIEDDWPAAWQAVNYTLMV
jgi:hypothetical protein